VLLVPRPETDEEVAKRVDAQRMREEQTVARERAELDRLLKKHGSPG